MHSTLFHSSFVAIVCICNSIIAFGQKEFLVTIEPITGSFTVIDSLPDVHLIQTMPAYTTYDYNNHRFIFKGVDFDANNRLYTIDAPTGDILTSPLFPQLTDISDNIIETQFDSELNTLYGLHWDNSDQQEYFVSIDQTSGIHTIISGLPGVHAIAAGLTTYDENNHHYIFHGVDNSGYQHLYTVDAVSGIIVSQPIINSSDNIGIMQYDVNTNELFALRWESSTQTEYIVLLNQITGSYTTVCNVVGVQSIILFPSYATYDSNSHHFIFSGGINNNWKLFSVNTQTGQVISNPVFPVLSDPNDNLIELQFDNSSNILYGLHWDNYYSNMVGINTPQSDFVFNAYPNPFTEKCTIELDKPYQEIKVLLYDENGQIVSKQISTNTSSITISRENLSKGFYQATIIGDHILLGRSKINVL